MTQGEVAKFLEEMQEARGGTVIVAALLTTRAVAFITGYIFVSTTVLQNTLVKYKAHSTMQPFLLFSTHTGML